MVLFSTVLFFGWAAPTTAQQKITYAESFLVDVRTPKEFQHGSVEGAVNIPLGTIKEHLSEFENKKQVVVFCHSGIRAMFAKGILNRKGIKPVVNGGNVPRVNRKLKKQASS
ncbi:MAG: rhodanese-like domain-containing protein [Chitinophagales bacterium]|nr:rhodanese-like domain-containing protein [Chitinophagales bacterium]